MTCHCGCGTPLVGSQRRWSSNLCKMRAFERSHPRVRRTGGPARDVQFRPRLDPASRDVRPNRLIEDLIQREYLALENGNPGSAQNAARVGE